MPNLSGRSAQSQADTAHNFAVLHARFMPEYSFNKKIIERTANRHTLNCTKFGTVCQECIFTKIPTEYPICKYRLPQEDSSNEMINCFNHAEKIIDFNAMRVKLIMTVVRFKLLVFTFYFFFSIFKDFDSFE